MKGIMIKGGFIILDKRRILLIILIICSLFNIVFLYSNNINKEKQETQTFNNIEKEIQTSKTIEENKDIEIQKIFEKANINILEAYNQDWYYHNGKITSFNVTNDFAQLYIPDIDISVPLVYINLSNSYLAQSIVDNINEAVYLDYGSSPIVADHSTQSFLALKKCTLGMKAFIKYPSRIEVYQCIKTDIGINNGKYIYDSNGNNAYEYSSDILTLYTCRNNWRDIYLIKFQKIG